VSDNKLIHDPRVKLVLKETLYEYMYGPAQKKFAYRLEKIINDNTVAGGYSHKSFMYRGEIYTCDTRELPHRMNRLVLPLQPTMNDYLRDIKELNVKELPYVLGYINRVLNSTNEFQDYLKLLPDSLHHPLQHLINNCPCKTSGLSPEFVADMQQNNKSAITMIKSRMALNLLL
jgi:hypothetical protein